MILHIKNISFAYKGNKPVWENLTFTAKPGEVLSILGPNGTGKSTLLRCIAGLEQPLEGEIMLGNKNTSGIGRKEMARKVAFVPQMHTPVFPFTALDVVIMGRTSHLSTFGSPSKRDEDIARKALETMGISHLGNVQYDQTSGGERQLILFARAVAQEAEILLLDEPTSHLDFGNQARILKLIRSLADKGLSVVMTTHFPDHAFEISETTCLLSGGKLIGFGPTTRILTSKNLSLIYGLNVSINKLDDHKTVCTAEV